MGCNLSPLRGSKKRLLWIFAAKILLIVRLRGARIVQCFLLDGLCCLWISVAEIRPQESQSVRTRVRFPLVDGAAGAYTDFRLVAKACWTAHPP